MNKAVFWDFDGTLVYSNESFLYSLDCALLSCGYEFEKSVIKSFLTSACSWNDPDKAYTDKVKEAWWTELLGKVKIFCQNSGVSEADSDNVCRAFRHNVINYEYRLYEDAEDILSFCISKGYRNYLLSNNFPELTKVVERFGLSRYFSDHFISANIGYEKPRKEIFEYALRAADLPDICYMAGDNPIADIKGAQAAGLKTILVHKKSDDIRPDFCCLELQEIKHIL